MHTTFPSNRLGRWLAVALLALLSATTAHAQLTGTKAIPGDYATVAAAITALNAQGVGTGGVTFSIAAGYTETFASPTAGAITATGTAANPVVFQKSGTGANPKITAGVGTATALDAIISLAGSDYVTFDGLDVADNAANTTATTKAEFGYALFRASASDGCQNNIIRNCVVTLDKTNAGTFGIYGATSTAASATAVAATSPAGANSNNKVYGNVVTNTLTGIYFAAGSATTVANYDQGNEIGVTAGNTIGNFGGAATAYGAGGTYQSGLKISGNTINSTLNYTSATASTAVLASTVTSTLRGIYTPNGTAAALDITNNTITLASGATASQMSGIETTMGATTVNITGNTVTGCTYATATSGTFYGLYNTGVPTTLNLVNNTVSNNTVPGTGSFHMLNAGSPTNLTITGNVLTGNTKGGVPATITSGSMYGINVGTATITATNNTVANNAATSAGTTATSTNIYGYYSLSSAPAETITGNTITGLSVTGTTTSTSSVVAGFYHNTVSAATRTLTQNTVGGLSIATAASGTVYGFYSSAGGNVGISRNKVYDLSAGGASGLAYGLYFIAGAPITASNNLIGDLRAPASTSAVAVSGIYVGAATTANLYANSVYLNAASTSATTFGTSGIYIASATPTVDIRNNVVVNTSTAGTTGGAAAALRYVSAPTSAMLASTTNNNLYYAGTPSATGLIYVEGSTTLANPQQTLAAYKAYIGGLSGGAGREAASVTENPPFLSTTGSAATFLHISPAVATQVESGGAPIGGITTDYDGDTRSTTTPDLGADEGTFLPLDLSAPIITFTALANTSSTTSRTLTATINDPSGVATGTDAPRLYYRKGTMGAYVFVSATSVSGSSYTFTLDYTAIGGVTGGDVVQYYVAAQDLLGNTGTSPAGGGGATPPGTTAPASPAQYLIQSVLAGTYYVGTGTSPDPTRTYPTLTAAINAYNINTLGGAVTFVLLDATYSTAETFPLVIVANADASATNTLTIKPNTGVSPTISGSVVTGAVLKLNGADYVTIDGSNNGTTSQNLTITNTSATGSGNAVLWLAAATATDGATNNVVKNTSITGNNSGGLPQFTVFLGGGGAGVAAPTTSTPAANSNNTFTNNIITKGYYGVFVFGVSATVLDQGNTFTGNQIGQAAAGTGFGQEGLRLVYQQGLTVTGNDVQNLTSGTASSNLYGIFLADSKSSVISRNAVHGISYSGTSTTKVWAINSSISAFTTAANASANRFDNNLVYGINSTAVSGTWNTVGLNLGGGYGDQIVYNTVYLSGQLSAAGGTAGSAAFANGNPSVTSVATNLDVRNNIFSIIGGTGGTTATPLYATYTYGASYTGSTLNYNDLYVTTGATGLAVIGHLGTVASPTGDYATLALWRTATSQEANSVSADPQFAQTATTPYNLTPSAVALNGAATPITGVTVDYSGATRGTLPDIGAYEFTPPACQAVSGLAFASITATAANITFTAPTSGAGANSYTVTYTPAGGTATTITPNPTTSPVALSGLTANTVYTVTVTTNCTGATSPSATGTFRTACVPPTYAALPASESFENTWLSRCDTREVPTATWLNTPTTGNNSWRREDDGPAANWTSPTLGAFTPAGSQGSAHSARFHSYYASVGAVGTLDFYVDLSAAGTKRLSFDYVNVSTDGSKIEVLLSTDGGATFSTTPLLSVTTSAAFSSRTLDLTATSATSVIRFKATSDFGNYDIGVDNVLVRVLPAIDLAATALATPTSTQGCYGSAETVAVAVTNQGTQALDFSVNPATVTATVTTPGGPQALTGSLTTGTLAPGATQNVPLTPTLDMTAVGTYTFALSATVTGDGNPANDALTPAPTRTVTAPVAGTLSPATASICVSGTAALTLTGAANGSIQYQSSADNVTFTDISGATSAAYTTPVLTTTTYYRAQVRCGTAVATSNVSTITVTNPLVAGTNTPVNICAGSPATLTATASAGSSVRFFAGATGGTALASTTPGSYTTPALTASTTYYAEAYSASSSVAGLADNAASNGTFVQSTLTDYPLGFAVTQAGILASADVYPSATGALTITLYRTTGGQPAGTTTAVAGSDVTITVTAAQVGTRVTVPLNYVLAAGDYRISNSAGTLGRFSTYTGTYPLTSGALTVRGSYTAATSTSFSNTTYNSFFNLTFNTECAGATRTAIQVNVTQPATASFAAATGSTCGTSAVTLAGAVGGSATGGTYTSSGTGTFSPNATTLTASYTPSAADVAAGSVTITLTSAGSTPCPAATATFALSISPAPVASFSYPAATTYCAGSASTVTPTLGNGATAGTFSSTSGLIINATTGVITLSTSTAGTYTVTNSIAASGACAAVSATTTVTITPATSAAFAYATGTFCASGTNPTPTVTGNSGGTFSSTTGLSIDATTGTINLSASTLGTYPVTYTVAGACGSSTTASVTITAAPVATFSYPTATTYCAGSASTVTPTLGTGASAGTFSSTTGLSIDAATGVITLSTSAASTYTVTNTIAASGSCAAATATTTVTITPATTATFAYSGTTFCASGTNPTPAVTGNSGGTFSSTAGLSIDATTGTINLSASTLGAYTVTYTVAGACGSSATASITITAAPLATFSYGTASTYCVSGTTAPAVVLGTGATAGTFSSTAGLTINATTGAITLASSTPSTYTVTNTVAGAGGCAAATATTTVTITAAPTATFSYPTVTTYCAGSTSTVSPTLSSGATAGTFSSTTGLSINATTGVITLSTSTFGTYTVTNTVAAAGGCAVATATATVTITPATTATFAYSGSTFCATGTNPTPTVTGTAGGTFTAPAGLSISATTGTINLSASTLGTYPVTYTVAGACGSSTTASVTVTAGQVATFSYGATSTYCVSGTTAPAVVLGTGATAGTFSSTAGLTINATTGAITLASSTPSTYTVTNTVAAAGGCAAATATTTVTITAAPTATFSYAAPTGCAGSTTAATPTLGTGASAGTFSSTTGLVINATTGAIDLTTSTASTYTVTNTVAAASGCAAATATTTFTVNPRPATPTFTAAYSSTTTTLTSSATTGNQWYLNGVAIAGATSQTYVVNGLPAQYGSYTVVVTNTNGCASLPSTPLVITAAKNGIAGASLQVYPNPTPTGQVTLELTGYRLATQLTVLDALGRVIISELLPANAGTATRTLDLKGVATGVYLLRLRNTDGVETRRLVRE